MEVTFSPLGRGDLPLLHDWLAQPHVTAWWDGRNDVDFLARKYGPRIDGTSATRAFTIRVHDEPVGLIQYTPGADYAFWPSELGLADAMAIDYLVGHPGYVRRNVGTTAIRRFLDEVSPATRASRFIASPQARNTGSCRALEKAGFTRVFEGDLVADKQPERRIYLRDTVVSA